MTLFQAKVIPDLRETQPTEIYAGDEDEFHRLIGEAVSGWIRYGAVSVKVSTVLSKGLTVYPPES